MDNVNEKQKYKEIGKIAIQIQNRCHKEVGKQQKLFTILKRQDAVNTWLYFELAVLTWELQQLRKHIEKNGNESDSVNRIG